MTGLPPPKPRLTYDERGFAVIEAAVRSVLDRALDEGLIVGHEPEVVVEPAGHPSERRLSVTFDSTPAAPYTVVMGREQELRDRLSAAVADALDPARPSAR